MARDLTRTLHSLFAPMAQALHQLEWQPAADIYRMRDGWLVKFDLAGVRPDDISVTVSGCRLRVRGRRRDWIIEESQGCLSHSMEIVYSHFERILELPCEMPQTGVTTEFREGMLLIRIHLQEPQP